jgi:hypothetical protein
VSASAHSTRERISNLGPPGQKCVGPRIRWSPLVAFCEAVAGFLEGAGFRSCPLVRFCFHPGVCISVCMSIGLEESRASGVVLLHRGSHSLLPYTIRR